MLEQQPRLKLYWDARKKECDINALRRNMTTFSHGERIMAQFYMAVWLGDNSPSFDLIEAIKTLEDDQLAIITDWLKDPFFSLNFKAPILLWHIA